MRGIAVAGILLSFGQKDNTETAFAQFLDYLVLIQIVVVVLILKNILLVKAQAGPPEDK